MEEGWLGRLAVGLACGASVLDLGCGTGAPIARWFLARGHSVTGVDFAPRMLQIARRNFPGATWIEADLNTLALGRRFDAVVAWDSFFHVAPDAQPGAIGTMARHLVLNGRLLLTTGHEQGEVMGQVGEEQVYHASLSLDAYRKVFADNGLSVLDLKMQDPDCGRHTVWLVQRTA